MLSAKTARDDLIAVGLLEPDPPTEAQIRLLRMHGMKVPATMGEAREKIERLGRNLAAEHGPGRSYEGAPLADRIGLP